MPVRFIRRAGNPPENTVVLRQFGWMYRILGSWTKRREHTRIGLVPWNILPSFMFTSAIWIMRYMSLAYRRRWLRQPKGRRKRKIGYVGFIGFFVSVFDSVFFRNRLAPNACWFYYRSDLDCYKDPTESACGSTQSRSQYSSHNIAPEPSGKSIGNEIRPLPRNNELHL